MVLWCFSLLSIVPTNARSFLMNLYIVIDVALLFNERLVAAIASCNQIWFSLCIKLLLLAHVQNTHKFSPRCIYSCKADNLNYILLLLYTLEELGENRSNICNVSFSNSANGKREVVWRCYKCRYIGKSHDVHTKCS